jgi:N-methylhydantoinase A
MIKQNIPRLGVDIGGTFTDVALEVDNRQFSAKVLTTSDAPEQGVMDAVQIIVDEAGIQAADVGLIIHGTTLATNALIERKGARTALVTTEGFRDSLEMRTESRYEQYDLNIEMPPPLVPRRRRFTVPERIDARGQVRITLDESAVEALVPTLKASAAEAIAIGLLHAYVNPTHERRVADILSAALPDVSFSLSHEVSPELREYERISTTCANAYVQPRMAGYLANLERMLRSNGYRCPLLMMLSGGGVATVETSIRFPVRLVESGPAGGAIFSSHIATECGLDKVLSFDMGGTTAKICLIDNGTPQTSHAFEVARIYRFKKGSGLPLRIPVIEMVEIGAGGGSIAAVDALNRISVGPQSAGSVPGPACYDQDGQRATVTDADLLLGRLDANNFAGGNILLDVNAAAAALQRDVGKPLSLDQNLAAFGVSEMVDENMSNAARVHSIESGKDSGDYTLIAFGGAAPVHCAHVAEKLGIDRFIVPAAAGVGSAVGFLRAPVAYEVVRSNYQRLSNFDANSVNVVLGEMSNEASSVVAQAAQGTPLLEKRSVFMRYLGQGHEIAVEIPPRAFSADDADLLAELFERAYANLYSRAVPGVGIETLTWTVSVSTQAPKRVVQHDNPTPYEPKSMGLRAIYDGAKACHVDAPVYEREQLRPGAAIRGPAVIVERETTTILSALFDAIIDARGNIDCRRRTASIPARQ